MAIDANQLVPMRPLAAPGGNDSGIVNTAMEVDASDVLPPDATTDTSWTAGNIENLTAQARNFGFPQPDQPQSEQPSTTAFGLPNFPTGLPSWGQPQAAPESAGIAGTQGAGTQGAYEVASMVDRVVGITPETIEAQSYTPVDAGEAQQATATGYTAQGYTAQLAPEAEGYEARGYEAQGYEALQGVARTTAENVSEAITRITGQDSPIMQRAVAQATAEANRRGLLNSSMAAGAAQGAILDRAMQIAQGDVQNEQFNVAQQNAMEAQNIQMGNEALRFTADARNQASAFLANAQNRAAEFLAAERNQNGRFNAEQSNRAAEFSANAQNQASQFLAAAQNQASIFNAGEANRLSMFTAEQANQAARFAAEMSQAASQFNASAFNQAQQRYADAMNAALAAEVDATNQSRRDLAMFQQQAEQNALDRQNRLDATAISAGASVQAASISASASMANAQAQRDFQAGENALQRLFTSERDAAALALTRETAGINAYNDFVRDVGAAMRDPNLTPEGLDNYIATRTSLYMGNPARTVDVTLGTPPPEGD